MLSKKKQNGEIEKQSFLASETANIRTLPMTKVMTEKFNITKVLLYSSFVPLVNKNGLLKILEWNSILQ